MNRRQRSEAIAKVSMVLATIFENAPRAALDAAAQTAVDMLAPETAGGFDEFAFDHAHFE